MIDAALYRKRTTFLIFLLLILAGLYAFITIPKESDPDINIPIIYVSLHHEGISPSDAERILLRPIEQELNTIEGVKEMRSTAYQSGANVILEFNAGFDVQKALYDVREAVDKAKSELPEETDEPTINEVNFSLFPVLIVTLSGDLPERALLRLARDLQDRIEGLPMVLEAPIAGRREEQVEIVVDPSLIESYGLVGTDIINFFSRSNRLVAAGNIDTGQGRFSVELPGLFETVQDIMAMPVLARGDSVITVADIANIRNTYKDPESFARHDGQKALALEVVKRTGENVIDTIDAIKAVVAEESRNWPPNVTVNFSQDRSEDIRQMLGDLQNNVISAILLVMIVCVAALGVRAAGLVGIAIPGSFLTGLLVLYAMGLTVNIVVLFALILAVGMLVDGAIVVTEYADRKMLEGLHREEAYRQASKRMSWPIIASTATTLAAFMPLLFWPDVVGEFMFFLPLTLISTLSASLLMALIFVPVMGSLIGKPSAGASSLMNEEDPLTRQMVRDAKGITGHYLRLLDAALKHPGKILILALTTLIGVQIAYAHLGKGVEFFPEVEPEVASILVHARGNLSILEQDALVREVEKEIFQVEGLKSVYARSGKSPSQGSDLAEDVIGQIQLEFEDWDKRLPADTILQEIRERTKDISGIHVETQKQEAGPGQGKALQIDIISRYPQKLPAVVDMVLRGVHEVGEFIDIEDSRPMPGIEWKLDVDRAQAAKFGLDITSIGDSVRLVTNGLKVAAYRPDGIDDEVDIVLRFPDDYRNIEYLEQIRIETPSASVPVTNFISRVAQQRVGQIERVDSQRVMRVKADLPPGVNVTQKVDEMRAWLASQDIDPDVRIAFKGQDEDQNKAQAFLMKAFIVALFVMAIILVTQFNSFYSALLILTAVIMSTVGVFIGLMITGQPFGIVMSGIGVIALAGIVVNNNIVLIDTFDTIRKQNGISGREAILKTGYQRFRPVMLTTITTILGLMPMVLSTNIDFFARTVSIGAPSTQWWVQLSTAVVFGMAFSTILTLVVTPSALMLRENYQLWKQRRKTA